MIDAPPEPTDPQLGTVPEAALLLPLPFVNRSRADADSEGCVVWVCGVGVVYLCRRLVRRGTRR